MAEASGWGWRALGLLVALVFVASATYLPHLDTTDADGADAWSQVATSYEAWLTDEDEEGYPYPIHVDEHIHWVFASTIQRFQTLDHPDIYTGQAQASEGISLRGGVHERGFHLALGQFQEMTGISWWTVFQYGPALWAGLIAVLVWAALDPWPGAPIAAGLTGLMPTTVRFLGPGFLVPITFGLAWVALVLVLLPRLGRTFRGPFLALLAVFWAFFIHVIAGFVALALLLAAIPFVAGEPREQGMRKRLAGIGLVAALPMIWLYEAFWEEILAEAEAFTDLPLDVTVFDQIGVAFLVAWIAGLGLVGYRAPRKRRAQFGATALLSLVLLATILSNFYYGPRLALYDRFHQPFLLMATIPVAYVVLATARGLVTGGQRLGQRLTARWRKPTGEARGKPQAPEDGQQGTAEDGDEQTRDGAEKARTEGHRQADREAATRKAQRSAQTRAQTGALGGKAAAAGAPTGATGPKRSRAGARLRGLAVALLAALLFVGLTTPGLAASLEEPYYRVLDEEDVERFRWIEANVGEEHERFLSHPWKAPILTAMTGKQPHAFLTPGSPPMNGEEYIDYLTGTSNDTRWLLERDIELVVGPRMPDSDVFVEPREGVAILEERYAEQQEARRGPAPPG